MDNENKSQDNPSLRGIEQLADQLGTYRRKLLDAGFTSPEMMILICKVQDQFISMGYNAAMQAVALILKRDEPTAQ
jgi:hypothetical protein